MSSRIVFDLPGIDVIHAGEAPLEGTWELPAYTTEVEVDELTAWLAPSPSSTSAELAGPDYTIRQEPPA